MKKINFNTFSFDDYMAEKNVKRKGKYDYVQYSVHPNRIYAPCSKTVNNLPSGLYKYEYDHNRNQWIFEKASYNNRELIRFEGSVSDDIIKEIDQFWTKEIEYNNRGETFKRGILMFGPSGCGKSATVSLLVDELINKHDGIALMYGPPVNESIVSIKAIEPNRRVMVIIEDIEIYVNENEGEAGKLLLNFLDGETQFNNIVVVGTSNYPEELPDTIKNRPSRFDRVIKFGLPSDKNREIYIKEKSKTLSEEQIKEWVDKTRDYTFAYLKELILSVEAYNYSFNETIERLNNHIKDNVESRDFSLKNKKAGFNV